MKRGVTVQNSVFMQNTRDVPINTVCIPSIKEVVCRWGAKCFHNIHYADCYFPFEHFNGRFEGCQPIPDGACLQGMPSISNFFVVFKGLSPDNRCCRICINYTITAILVNASGIPIGLITPQTTDPPVQVPIFDVPNVLCFGPIINHGVFTILPPRVYSATITKINGVNTAVFRVEKEFGCFESRQAIVCQLECSPDEPACTPPMPTPPTSPGCPTFTTPTVCFEFCVDDERTSPGNCDQCPPPQVFTDPEM